MKKAPAIFLIRHPAVDIAGGTCYGRLDVSVNEEHLLETTSALAAQMSETPPQKIISSPSQRCIRLACELVTRFELNTGDIVVNDHLQELNFGAWEGQRWDDIGKEAIDVWAHDWINRCPPGGESYIELKARALNALNALLLQSQSTGETLWVIGSSGPLKAMRLHLENRADTDFPKLNWALGEAWKIA